MLHLRQDKETILVLNKVDLVHNKSSLLSIVRKLTNGVVGGQKSHQTAIEVEREKKEGYMARNFDPKEMVKQLIAENEATVGKGMEYGITRYQPVLLSSAYS